MDDRILLCSDGLSDVVFDADIAALVAEAKSTADACETLVSAALLAGGPDNITVVLARMLESMQPHPLKDLHARIDSKADGGAVTKVE